MSPAALAAIAALIGGGAAAGAGPSKELRVAYAPSAEVGALLLHAFPPKPSVVVRSTNRYGEVTIDHEKHLAVRAPCSECHDILPVGPITFTPQVAHRACIGCHTERAAGPTQCAGCHNRPLPPPPATLLADVREPTSAPPPPAAAAPLPPPRLAVSRSGPPSRHTVDVGLAVGGGYGLSLRVTSRRERFLSSYSLERVGDADTTRILGLLGAGFSRPILPGWHVVGVAMGGFDAVESPALTVRPAIAARAGLEWRPMRSLFETVHLGVTGVYDLTGNRAFHQEVGTTAFFATLSTGLRVTPKPGRNGGSH